MTKATFSPTIGTVERPRASDGERTGSDPERVRKPFRLMTWIVGLFFMLISLSTLVGVIKEYREKGSAALTERHVKFVLPEFALGVIVILAAYPGFNPFREDDVGGPHKL